VFTLSRVQRPSFVGCGTREVIGGKQEKKKQVAGKAVDEEIK